MGSYRIYRLHWEQALNGTRKLIAEVYGQSYASYREAEVWAWITEAEYFNAPHEDIDWNTWFSANPRDAR